MVSFGFGGLVFGLFWLLFVFGFDFLVFGVFFGVFWFHRLLVFLQENVPLGVLGVLVGFWYWF